MKVKQFERELGAVMPASWYAAYEKGLFAQDGLDYYLYGPDDVCRLSDHELADEMLVDEEAVVIGERHHPFEDHLLIYRGEARDGQLMLEDDVYSVQPGQAAMEAVAASILTLCGVLDDAVDTLVQAEAFTQAPASAVLEALREALGARGFEASKPGSASGGESLRVQFYEGLGADQASFLIDEARESQLALIRSVATRLEAPVEAHEVMVRDEWISSSNGEEGYWVRTRSVSISPQGTTTDLETDVEVEEVASHGDLYETAAHVLLYLVQERVEPRDMIEEFRVYRAGRDQTPLPPRLRALVVAIAEATDVSRVEIAGQQAVRLETADGARQMSVLSDAELDLLRAQGALPDDF